ncbi:MAG: hypothetical protein WC455_26750 [Dehalococcoidia bacterium]|jgi:hypothetical protein
MNDTLKKLTNLITLREQGTITELDLLLELHDLWRDVGNQFGDGPPCEGRDTFDIVNFAYIHFKQCCDVELEKATK